MNKRRSTYKRWLMLLVILLIAVVIGGWRAAEYLGDIARQEIINDKEDSLSLLSTYIISDSQKFECAVKSLAAFPWISSALILHGKQDIKHVNSALDRYNSAFNASVTYLMDIQGVTVASSNRDAPDSFVGKSYRFRPYFQAAMQGNQGRYYAIGITSGKRGFYTSYPVRNDKGEIIGVIAMKKDIDEWETYFGTYTNAYFVDTHGVIFLSSEKALPSSRLWPINEKIKQDLLSSRQFGDRSFKSLLSQEVTDKMDIIFNGSHYITFRKVVDPEGWSIVILSPTDRITVYKSVGVILTILICTLIAIPLIVNYRTARSAEMVRESEERFRSLADSTFEGILIHDKGEILDLNQSLLQMLGYEYDEVIGKNLIDFVAPESRNLISLSRQGETETNREVLIYRKDRRTNTMEVHGKPIVYKGIQARVVALRDITERKQAEEALRKSEERFRLAAERTNDLIYERDMITGIATFFADMDAFHGYEPGGFPRSLEGFIEHLHPDDVNKAGEALQLANEQNKPYEVIHRLRRKDGSYVTWLDRATIIKDDKGFPLKIVGAATDITERIRSMEILKESEERYRILADNISDIIFVMDLNVQFTYCSPSVKQLLGYNPEEFLSKSIEEILTPSSNKLAMEIIAEEMEMEKNKPGYLSGPRTMELELIRKDGSTVWMEIRARFLRDSNGQAINILGVSRNITERKRAEDALRYSEEKYRGIIDSIDDAYFEADLSGHFTFFNDILPTSLGFSKNELMGESFKIAMDEENAQKVFDVFHKVYETGIPARLIEWEATKKDKTKVYVESSVVLLRDEENRTTGFHGVIRDITDRKAMHEQLRNMAITDQLTELYNRRGFITLAEQQLKSADRTKRKVLLSFIDIDNMKHINDVWGHEEGDRALVDTAKLLKQAFRESDIIARVGGDEFAVLASDVTDTMKEVFLNRILQQIDTHNAQKDLIYMLTLSIGSTFYEPDNPCSLDELMSKADKLMYQDKRRKVA